MVDFLAPKALRTPISRVRSVTETIMIFIKAIDEPKMVMILIIQEAQPKYFVIPRILLIRSSLRTTPKLLSRTGLNLRTLRIVLVAWSMA
ncbi:hypothetical protein D3C80_1509650 [compost metagenome]